LTLDELCRLHGSERAQALNAAYHFYNHARFRGSDPVSFVWKFTDQQDREIAALCASSLAYGRVASIQQALKDLDQRWEQQPAAFLLQASEREQRQALRGFVYRWTRESHLFGLLGMWRHMGSQLKQELQGSRNARQSLASLYPLCLEAAPEDPGHLFSNPAAPSACKRLAMWLRWMIRKDEIDPGTWAEFTTPDCLWMPLDTHIHKVARRLRLTRRQIPDGEAALRITRSLAKHCPEDPLRYDFALTRISMGVH